MSVEPLPPCGDDEPERNAGGPIDDGWEKPVEPHWNPDDDLAHAPPPPDPHAFDDVVPQRLATPPGGGD
ncbi:MAG TPA: hypothetical protein VFF37_14480 [Streptomyces sp.]|nr:hypothetical protein [Streptomyces sp.]